MNVDLWKSLLNVEAESFDRTTSGDVANDPRGELVFGRFCSDILNVYRKFYPGISAAWVSVAGIEPGCFTPIASHPVQLLRNVPKVDRQAASALAPAGMAVMVPLDHEYLFEAVMNASQVILIRLIGYEEYHGILALSTDDTGYFNEVLSDEVRASIPLLNRLMAEAVFSKRLKTLAAPIDFHADQESSSSLYDKIAHQACLGLAADGSVLRIRKPSDKGHSGYTLEVKGHHGLLAGELQLAEGSVFERICRRVFESTDFVTTQTLKDSGVRDGFRHRISDLDNDELRKSGIQAYMILKLQSDLHPEATAVAMGTLSVFHRLPQAFSRRDISLFRSFGERVADDLTLMDQRDENRAISRLFEAQINLGTRAEITALLGHDFGHRVYHLQNSFDEFIETCIRTVPPKNLPDRFHTAAATLKKNTEELGDIVRQIRLFGLGADEPPITFDVGDLFKGIREQLRIVLERYNTGLDTKTEGDCHVWGVRSILMQALFNLVINSIDAQKAAGNRKSNTVHLTCREIGAGAARKLEFKVWDEGPGISWAAFPDAQRIFEIGTTSKPAGVGTGTGLPAARSLLGRYFHADLQLMDRTKALFQFSIPSPPHKVS